MEKTLKKLKPKRCFGFDRIPLVFLKDGASELVGVVKELLEKISEEKKTPDQWKVARILPLFKKGDKEKIENYRPISKLTSITKIFEKVLLHPFQEIQEKKNIDLTSSSQDGFKKNRNGVPRNTNKTIKCL